MQLSIPQSQRSGLQFIQDHLPKTSTLKIRMYSHPFDFSEFSSGFSKRAHSGNTPLVDAYQKFASVMKVDILDIVQIIVPWAIAKISSNFLQA